MKFEFYFQRLRFPPLISSIDLAGVAVPLSDTAGTFRLTLDDKLTFPPRITNLHVGKSCFNHIKAKRHIKSALTKNMWQTTPCSLISSRIDYANSLFVGLSDLFISCSASSPPRLA